MEHEQRTTRTQSVRVEEYDMVLAQNLTQLRNALVEKGILGPEHKANSDGHSIFSTCIVCNKTYPSLRSEYEYIHCKVSMLENTIREERREREQLDVIIAHKIAELTNERNVLMSYTSDVHKDQAYSILYNCVVCSKEKRNTRILPCAHIVTCKGCTADIMKKDKKCPVCKMEIRHVMWP